MCATLSADLLQQIFGFIPGHHLILRLVCRDWASAYVGDKVTFVSSVLQEVETFRSMGMILFMTKPQLLYYHASYELLEHLSRQGVNLSVITKMPEAEHHIRWADHKVHPLLKSLAFNKYHLATRLMPDFAATPPELHEGLLRKSKFSGPADLLWSRFAHGPVLDVDAQVVRRVYRIGGDTYAQRYWYYVYGWDPLPPSPAHGFFEVGMPQVMEVLYQTDRDHLEQYQCWWVLGNEAPDVCLRMLEMLDRRLHLESDLSRPRREKFDVIAFLGKVRSNIDYLITQGCHITCDTSVPSILPVYGEAAVVVAESFFEMRHSSVGGILGAVFFGNLDALKAAPRERVVNIGVMSLAVELGRFNIACWLRLQGLPIRGRYRGAGLADFEWMVAEGWRGWTLEELSPQEILVLLERRLIQVDLKRLKNRLYFSKNGKKTKVYTSTEPMNADLWRLMDWLVQNNCIYPSALYSKMRLPYHDSLLRRWAAAGYLDKPEECPIDVPLVERTRPLIPRSPVGGVQDPPYTRQPLTAAQVEDGQRFVAQGLVYIETFFDREILNGGSVGDNTMSVYDHLHTLPVKMLAALKGIRFG